MLSPGAGERGIPGAGVGEGLAGCHHFGCAISTSLGAAGIGRSERAIFFERVVRLV
jgi:hypothetical protein